MRNILEWDPSLAVGKTYRMASVPCSLKVLEWDQSLYIKNLLNGIGPPHRNGTCLSPTKHDLWDLSQPVKNDTIFILILSKTWETLLVLADSTICGSRKLCFQAHFLKSCFGRHILNKFTLKFLPNSFVPEKLRHQVIID